MEYPLLGDIHEELVLRGSQAPAAAGPSSSDQWFEEYTDRMMIQHLLLLEDHLLDYAREPSDQCMACMFWHIAKIRAYASLECVKFSEGAHRQVCVSISPVMDKLEAELEDSLSQERSLEWAKEVREWRYKIVGFQSDDTVEEAKVLEPVLMATNPRRDEDLCLTVRDTEMVCSTKSYAHDVVRCQTQVEKLAEFTCGAAMTFEPPKAGHILRAEFPQAAGHHSLTPTWQTVCLMPHAGRGIEVALVGDHSIKFVGTPWVHIFADYAKGKGLEAYSFLPCRCGYFGHPIKECTCTIGEINKQQAKIKAQYTDLSLDVPDPEAEKLVAFFKGESRCEAEERMMQRVEKAKAFTFEDGKTIDPNAEPLLKAAIRQLHLDAKAVDSIRSVSISIARLAGSSVIGASHLAEAIQYRPRNPGTLDAKEVLMSSNPGIGAALATGAAIGVGLVVAEKALGKKGAVSANPGKEADVAEMWIFNPRPNEWYILEQVGKGKDATTRTLGFAKTEQEAEWMLEGIKASRIRGSNPIALSECEKAQGLGPKLGRCIGHIEERNVERGCPPGGLGTSECPNVYAVCRASISQPVCPLN